MPSSANALLIRGGTLLTMDVQGSVVHADLLIEGGRITAIGDSRSWAIDRATAPEVLDATGCVVLPGLVQAHLHLGQTIFRGLAERRRLLAWLEERIWPLEAAHDDESAYWCSLLGAAECLLGGTTTIQDIGLGPGSRGLLEAIRDSGLRAFAGHCLMDEKHALAKGLAGDTEQELRRTAALGDEFDGAANGRMRYSINPRFILSCSDALWRGARALSESRGWPIHTHALEQEEEGERVRHLKGYDEIDYFDQNGILSTDLRIAHGVQLPFERMEKLAQHRFSVAHCPTSNLKLGSGIADVVGLMAAGIPVGIGADGAPCNNDLDVLEEVRLAALLQSHQHGPGALSAAQALRLATSEGARSLGLEDQIGSLEVGKLADVVILSTERPELWSPAQLLESTAQLLERTVPLTEHDYLCTQIVYGASRANVRDVLVCGRVLVQEGLLVDLDVHTIRTRAHEALVRLLARAEL